MAGLLILAAAQPIFSAQAKAEAECEAHANRRLAKGEFIFHEENDAIGVTGSDQNYTQGIRFGYTWQPGCEWEWTKYTAQKFEETGLGRAFGLNDANRYTRSTSVGAGQHIWTPLNLSDPNLIPTDRPYAGWLYTQLRYDYAAEEKWTSPNVRAQSQVSFEMQVGVIGNVSLAEEAQTFIHDHVTHSEHPRGWRHQLSNEAGIFLKYDWQRRIAHRSKHIDIVPEYSLALGNIQTFVAAGLTLRAGSNISGFPTQTLGPSAPPFRSRIEAREIAAPELGGSGSHHCGFSWISECYLFAEVEGRYFAHNIFLDGNTFADSHSVDKVPFVYDLSAGFRLRFKWRNLTANYIHTRRSNEFTPVPADAINSNGMQEYGALTFHWDTYLN